MLQIPNLNFYTVKSDEFTLKTTSQASNFPRSHRATVNLPLVQSPLIYVNAEAASPTVALRPHCATAAFFDFQQIKSSNSFTARSCSSNREACVRALLLQPHSLSAGLLLPFDLSRVEKFLPLPHLLSISPATKVKRKCPRRKACLLSVLQTLIFAFPF